MSWGINPNAPQHEKIFSEFADNIGAMNSVGRINYNEYSDIFDMARDMFEEAYEQGKKDAMEKYKWHDLRKNPEDLPIVKTNMHIVFADGGQTLATYYPNSKYKYSSISYENEEDGYVNYTDVIAWREIEPFEEVET